RACAGSAASATPPATTTRCAAARRAPAAVLPRARAAVDVLEGVGRPRRGSHIATRRRAEVTLTGARVARATAQVAIAIAAAADVASPGHVALRHSLARHLIASLIRTTAKIFARLHRLPAAAAIVFLLGRRVAIADALTMIGVVLPFAVVDAAVVDLVAVAAIDVVAIEVVVVVDVDIDVAVSPIAVAP